MYDPLRLILRRLDRDRPVIGYGEFQSKLQPHWDKLGKLEIVRESAPAGWITCDDCGGHRCRLEYLVDRSTRTQSAFASCPECGVYEVPRDQLRQWTVDIDQCLNAVFTPVKVAVQLAPQVAGRLWRVGKATLAGRSRELMFSRCYRREDGHAVVTKLKRCPKSIVFVPTEETVGRIAEMVANIVIALESVVMLEGDSIHFDIEHVEGRLLDDQSPVLKPPKPPMKRGDRAANIQKFRNALIEHINAARNHAKFTKESTGTPKLLKRPSRKHLAEQVGLKPHDFTRCYEDETAAELRLLWGVAGDLDQIIQYSGSIRPRRESNS